MPVGSALCFMAGKTTNQYDAVSWPKTQFDVGQRPTRKTRQIDMSLHIAESLGCSGPLTRCYCGRLKRSLKTWKKSYGPLPVISTYIPIYRLYNPIYNQL